MATRTWLDVSGDWEATANWSDATVPVTDDDVVIGSGTQDITTNVDQNTVTLASLRIGDNYTGKIGTSSAPLKINSVDVSFAGQGSANYIRGEYVTVTVTDGAATPTMLDIFGAATSTPITSNGITTLRVLGGRGTINIQDGTLTTLEMIGASSTKITLASAVDNLANITMDGGTLETRTNIGTKAIVLGGTLKVLSTATAGEIECYDGGDVKYNTSGTLTTLEMYGGTFSLLDNTAATVAITNSTMYEGAIIRLDNSLQNVNLSNPMTIQGGEVRFPPGSTITVA